MKMTLGTGYIENNWSWEKLLLSSVGSSILLQIIVCWKLLWAQITSKTFLTNEGFFCWRFRCWEMFCMWSVPKAIFKTALWNLYLFSKSLFWETSKNLVRYILLVFFTQSYFQMSSMKSLSLFKVIVVRN